MLRLIQLSKRELRVLNELFFILKHENRERSIGGEEALNKERLLINELIQIERDKREEYLAISQEMDCQECPRDEKLVLKSLAKYFVGCQNRLLDKLGDELLSVIAEISIKNTHFQMMLDEQINKEVETITLDQVLPYLPSIKPVENIRSETNPSINQIHSN